jgi:enolase-phosphatase E1
VIAMQGVKGILLDIEGTTSSIDFVHQVMFSYALEHLDAFLKQNSEQPDVGEACQQIALDAGHGSLQEWIEHSCQPAMELVAREVRRLTAENAKTTGLKQLQGLIWKGGFESGELQAHIYPDVIPAIENWRGLGKDVRIYSSGSIGAQKLFFGHLEKYGNCLHLLSGHYDTTFGGKKEPDSYVRIASDWGIEPGKLLFISDVASELEAARVSGLKIVASVRPGNLPLPPDLDCIRIGSFAELEFGGG